MTTHETISKVMDLPTAVNQFVEDGATIALEGFGHLIPFAVGHEIIRQRKRDLTLCRMTPDLITDQMLAAGSVSRLIASFFASGSAGSLYEVRRRVEKHDPAPLEIEEYSHHGMVCRYQAAAAGLPFFPLRSYAGSDLPEINKDLRKVKDPYGDGEIYVVPPLAPDVTALHAQRADSQGNVQMWGIVGAQQEAAFAAKKVIVTVEEIVDTEVIQSDPNRTLIPSHAVDAVVHCPQGAYPSYAQGYYDRDNLFYRDWTPISRDPTQIRDWIDHWIRDLPSWQAFIDAIDPERWESLQVEPRLSGRVDYGQRRSGLVESDISQTSDTNGGNK